MRHNSGHALALVGPGAKLRPLSMKQNSEGNYDVVGLREEVVADVSQARLPPAAPKLFVF